MSTDTQNLGMEQDPTSMPQPVMNRRDFLDKVVVGAVAWGIVRSNLLFDPAEPDKSEENPLLETAPSEDQLIDPDHIDALSSRAEELNDYSTEELAGYVLESKRITFDSDYPRIEESMKWAKEKGVFPLVNPQGDIRSGVKNVSPTVPVQKPLLIALALISDVGLEAEITSLSTSSEHGQGSHHYRGRGVDIATPEQPIQLMRFLNRLNAEGIVAVDELFAPGNPGGFGLNEGQPSGATEGNHIHFSTIQEENWREVELLDKDSKMFEDERANDAAENLGINPGSYFNITREQGQQLAEQGGFEHGLANESLLTELFPAEVSARAEAIEFAAQEAGISPNFLATIATIESAGIETATSNADAYGITQIVVEYHRERIDRLSGINFPTEEAGDQDREEYLLNNPDVALRVGADYLKELLVASRTANPELNPNHPAIYARTAAGYNAGPERVSQDWAEWPFESQMYANYVTAFYIDTSVAGALRSSEMSSEEVSRAMVSESLYARMVAFRAFGPKDGYDDYSDAYRLLEVSHPGVDENVTIVNPEARTLYNLAKANYESFDNEALSVTRGLPPAVQFWVAHGGFNLLRSSEENAQWQDELAQH